MFAHPASAQGGPGTTAATFLQLGFGSRPIGMGEAYVAVADDASALYYNPGGLAAPAMNHATADTQRPWEVLAAQSLYIQGIQISQIGIVHKPFGFSVTYLNVGGIEGRSSETDTPDNTFGASDMAVGMTYAREFHGVGLGLSGKFIQESIGTYSANTETVDAGALYRFPEMPLSLGASVANLGGSIRFIDQSSSLPRTFRLGAAWGNTPKFPVTVSLQVDLLAGEPNVYRLGTEYTGFGPFALRMGYEAAPSSQRSAILGEELGTSTTGVSEFFGLFMGAGFRFSRGSLDYAMVPYGELGTAHRFSASLRF